MENQQSQNFQPNNMQIPLPNATVVLILGIISILGCCCYGVIGIICGIVALIMYKSAMETYNANPDAYLQSSLSNLNAGRVCGIIGLILSSLYLIVMILIGVLYGFAAMSDPEAIRNIFTQY